MLGTAICPSSPAATEKIHSWFGISLAARTNGVSLVQRLWRAALCPPGLRNRPVLSFLWPFIHGPARTRWHAPSHPSDTGQSPAAPLQTLFLAAYAALLAAAETPLCSPGKGTSTNIGSWLPSAAQRRALQVSDKCSSLSMNAPAVYQRRH